MHEYRGSWHSVQKFIGAVTEYMIKSNLLDAIPCNVKAENISNCNKCRKNSDVGSKRGILKLLGAKISNLNRRIVLLSASILAGIKSTNVNEKLAQIIVKCSRIVSWPRELERSSKY